MLVSSFNLSQSFNYAPYLFCKKWFKSEINCFCIRTQGRVNNDLISLHIHVLRSIFSSMCVWERYSIYYLHMEGKYMHHRFAISNFCSVRLYWSTHLFTSPCVEGNGQRCALFTYDPIPGFLPADSRWGICVLTCITITAPKMSSFP